MPTNIEYALMAGSAYVSTRSDKNTFPAPIAYGWAEIKSEYVTKPSGFEAVSFTRGTGVNQEIVISYAGTNFSDLTGDWATNVALAAGQWSVQLLQAAEYYMQIKALYPQANITFTGHSLGGGLAAIMSVFFNKDSVTFDQAPFGESVIDADLAIVLRDALITGFPQSEYPQIGEWLASLNLFITSPEYELTNRKSKVTNINVRGEALALSSALRIETDANTLTLEHGGSADVIELHSQSLLTAFLMNDDFRQLTYKLTALLEMLFNSDLYARPVGGSDENFLERLIRHQEGVVADSERGVTAVAADDMLTRFTDDLTMIAQEGGLTMNENIAKALTAFAMQMYYDDNNPNSTDASKKLFDDDSVTGGVHFKPSDLAAPLETTKGYKLYFKHYLNFLPGAEINLAALTAVEGKLPKLIDWYIQAGTSPMNATAGSDPVFMLGGTGNDTLTGGSDDDVLIGGQGIDHLNGGSGNDLLIGGSDGDIIEGGSGNNTLYGGYSNDHLFGGKDNDVIFGGGGNDVIYAGGGFNSLNDESGHDTYKLVSSGIDTIGDSDGKGSVYLNNVQLIGGKKIRECVYTNGGNTYIWSGIEGTPLIINRSKIISNFHNEKKDLGIYLYEDKDDGGGSGSGGWDGGVGAAGGVTIPCDPLLIDLNGDGIQTSSLTSGTFFDYDGNGFAERMGWASSDDGILVTDRNQDGIINDGSELFGDQTLLSAGKKAANGFQALADLDSNADGKIDANDTAYSNLRIWRDSNSDGYAQESELFTLEDVGISSINLTATAANITDAGGNTQTLSGTFTKTDGTIGEIADYNLQSDSTYSIPAAWVTIPEDIAALPDLQGYGNVYNLQQAMAMDATGELKALVEQFIAEENPATRKAIMEQILFHWTDSEDITKNRGNMDGRQLATLEKFTGENFMGQFGPNPNAPAQVILEQSYQNLLETSYCHLMVQTHLQDLYGKITYAWNETTQTMKADLSAVTAELAARLASDPTQGREDLAEFARSLRGMGIQEMVNYLSFRETFISMDAALGWVIDSANGNRTNDAVYGTAGDETLSNGSDHAAIVADGGNDTVRAGAGNDTIDGGNGNDTLYGEAGSDTYIFRRGDGHDVIIDNDSTAGNVDTIWFGNNISPEEIIVNQSGNDLILKLKDTMDAITVQGYYQSYSTAYRIERIKFIDGAVWHATDIEQQKLMTQTTASDDLMYGTAQDDVLSGLKGNDIIYGLGGHDSLSGNEDNDKLYGGSGSDTLAGGTGDDKLYGEADHDVLLGGDGHDSLYGGAGHDALDGGAGNDVLNGGADDYWHNPAYNGEDTYRFGRGSGQDTIIDRDATPGNLDTILLEPNVTPEDVVLSHRNDDLILSIKDTGDTITVMNWFKNESSEYQVERIEFSDDTVWDAAAIKLILLQGTSGNDALIGYSTDDIIQALAGNDNLYGHAGQDLLDGGAGDDYLFSGAGNDTLDGGAGNDKLYGGSDNLDSANGNDTYLFSRGDGQDTIYDYDTTPGNLDTILLGDDITPDDMTLWRDYDYLTLSINGTTDAIMISDWFNESGAYQVEQIKFADGTIWDVNAVKQMQLQATSGDDKIIGYSTADDIQGLEGGDQLYGRAGDDILDGGAGEDHIYGETGNDVLLGGEDDDVLYGGDGHDTLDGGEGYDILYGGIGGRKYYDKITNLSTGNDTYLFGRGSGQDFIYDYDATSGNLDTILLDSDVTPDDVALSRNNNDLTLTIEDTGDTITVSNWFESDEYQIERIGFADGTVWNVPIISEMLYKGTAGNDVLIGSYAADTIQGLEGDDQLYGRAGDDILDGGAGNDTLYGQTGNDTYLFGRGSGYDVVIDQDNTAGNLDTILLNSDITPGDVTLRRNGDSLIFTINNSAGSITVSNWFSGEAGNNQIERIEFCDGTIWDASAIKQIVIQATPGNDVLIGYSTADDIRGLEGRDRLYGRAGGDTLDGGAGNDQLYGETGNDTYLFGRGFGYDIVIDQDNTAGNLDTILLDPDITPNDVDLKRSGDDLILSINDTNDKITVNNWFLNESNEYQVERIQFADGTVWDAAAVKLLVLQGTSDDDVLIGYSTADSIQGLEGNDQIYGYAGDDTIDGGAGHDEIDGNAGNDELFGGADNDTIYGDAGDDYLDGGHHIQIGCIEYFYKKYSSKSLERGIDRRIFIS